MPSERVHRCKHDGVLVTSVRVQLVGGHEHVSVWNRGGLAGTLTVNAGDGDAIADRLLPQAHREVDDAG